MIYLHSYLNLGFFCGLHHQFYFLNLIIVAKRSLFQCCVKFILRLIYILINYCIFCSGFLIEIHAIIHFIITTYFNWFCLCDMFNSCLERSWNPIPCLLQEVLKHFKQVALQPLLKDLHWTGTWINISLNTTHCFWSCPLGQQRSSKPLSSFCSLLDSWRLLSSLPQSFLLSSSSKDLVSRPFIISAVLLWTWSNSSIPFLNYDAQNWADIPRENWPR